MMSKTIALGEICNIYKGKIGIQAAIPGLFPLVTTAEERASHNEYHFEGEAVCIPLVSATGHGHASIKRLQFESGRFCVGSILAACLPKDYTKTSAKFLYMYLSLFKDSLLVSLMQGSANVSLRIKDIEKVEVPDISFEEQIKIVELIDRLKSRQDAILSELDKQQSYLKRLRQAILQEAVQGKLTPQLETDEPASELLKRIKAEKGKLVKEGKLKKEKELPPINEEEIPFELPKGWVWCRLGEILSQIDYGTSEKASLTGDVPILRMNNIQEGKIKLSNLKFVKSSIDDLPKLYLKSEDLIFNRTNSFELVGKCGVYFGKDNEYTFASYLIRVAFLKELASVEYVSFYINSSICRQTQIEPEITQQTGQANFSGSKLRSILLPLPPFNEQIQIVAKVKQLSSLIDQLEQQVINSQAQTQQLLQSVLKEAFRGKSKEYLSSESLTLAAEA